MSCSSYALTGITTDLCDTSIGGIKKVWIADYQESAVTLTTGDTKYVESFASGVSFKLFTFRKNTGSMTSNLQVSDEAGNYVQTDLSLSFSKMETAKRIAIQALCMSETIVVVEDCNGKKWFLGKDNGVEASAAAGQTGTARSDANSYTITLTDSSLEFPYELKEGLEVPVA